MVHQVGLCSVIVAFPNHTQSVFLFVCLFPLLHTVRQDKTEFFTANSRRRVIPILSKYSIVAIRQNCSS